MRTPCNQDTYICPNAVRNRRVPLYTKSHSCNSDVNESIGERVPLVSMIDRTPCSASSLIVCPGLKHQ